MTENNKTAGQGALPLRDSIPAEHKWKLSDLYESDEQWENEFLSLKEEIESIPTFKGSLSESSDRMLAWMTFIDNFNVRLGKLGSYAFRKYDEDTTNSQYQGFMNRVMSFYASYQESSSWVMPELLAIDQEVITTYLSENECLRVYEHALLDLMRMKKHTLSAEGEQLLALSQETAAAPSVIFGMFNDADISFPSIKDEAGDEIEITKGRYIQLLESKDRRVRQDAFNALYSVYDKWKNTLASTLNGQVKQSIFYAKARKHSSTRAAALHADNIPVAVYDNVVESINSNLEPLQRATTLRKNILGLESVKPWDLYVPLVAGKSLSFSYEDAKDIVRESAAALGEEYAQDLSKAFSDGWIDVYENKGKRSGAYSAWTYGKHPFVLLNYTNTLKDVFTLAHELGHSMHSYYTWKNQPPAYGGYSIFCAEVASTCNEILLVDHMLKQDPGKDLKLHLLLHQIDTIRGTVYNQALFAEFEYQMHSEAEAGAPLTAEFLSAIMTELYTKYYGADFEMDALLATNWARIPHFYRSFYVFQYATGFSAAAAIAKKILSGNEDSRHRYLDFLKSGSSAYSIELLQSAGVDMNSPAPIEATAEIMSGLLDEVEALL
jgi:oligoendopeptidase F